MDTGSAIPSTMPGRDDRHRAPALADPAGDVHARDVREPHVEDDRIDPGGGQIEAIETGGGDLYHVALGRQQLLEEVRQTWIVFDDEDVHLGQYLATGS